MSIHQLSEADLNGQALDHDCPACGAAPRVRCRLLTRVDRGPGYPVNTKVDVRRKPCPERTTVAWRRWIAEQGN